MLVILLGLLVLLLIVGGVIVVYSTVSLVASIARARPLDGDVERGHFDVTGRAAGDGAVEALWTGQPALVCRVTVQYHRGFRDGWKDLGSAERCVPFRIEGAAGGVRVASPGAHLMVARVSSAKFDNRHPRWPGLAAACGLDPQHVPARRLRVREETLLPGATARVLGRVTSGPGLPVPHAFRQGASTELVMQSPILLTDKTPGALWAALVGRLVLGLAMFAAGAGSVVALVVYW